MEQSRKINIGKDERKRDGQEANKQNDPPILLSDVNIFPFLRTQHTDSLHVRLIDDDVPILIMSAIQGIIRGEKCLSRVN